MSGCSRTVPGDASCARSGVGIHDMALESRIFMSLELSGEVWEHLRYLYLGHAHGACLGAWYYSKDCLHLGQNLPKFLVSKA